MKLRHLDRDVYVADQLTVADLEALAHRGVRSMLGWALTSLDAKGVNAVVEAVTGAGFDTATPGFAITKETNPACHKEES